MSLEAGWLHSAVNHVDHDAIYMLQSYRDLQLGMTVLLAGDLP